MIYKPYYIINLLKESRISICENDLLITFTPQGVGVINQGDEFHIELFYKENKILEVNFK